MTHRVSDADLVNNLNPLVIQEEGRLLEPSRLLAAFHTVLIRPRRIVLSTPGVQTTVPQLRGVWGAALRGLDREAYDRVFDGTDG